jgi:TonB family protein
MSGLTRFEPATAYLVACFVKATIVLGAAWMLSSVWRGMSAAFRHSIWAAAILAALALPFMFFVPAWHSTTLGNAAAVLGTRNAPLLYGGTENVPAMIVNAVLTGPAKRNWGGWIFLGWALGFCVFAVRFGAGLIGLRGMSGRCPLLSQNEWIRSTEEICNRLGIGRRVRLLNCERTTAMPVTWGAFRPVILLPACAKIWSEARRRSVLSHELAHVARLDWPLQICAELMRAIYWFHPLAWVATRRLRREGERACDDTVLNSGIEASDYAKQLLELASTLRNSMRSWSSALAIARQTNLEGRFSAMLNPSINRRNLSRGAKTLVTLAAVCVLIPLAALRLPAQSAGKFSGIISDPSGMPVANATVILDNHKANGIQMTTSDAEGKYSFAGLPAGEYEVRVTKPGFAEFRATISSLDSGHDSPHNEITLQIGGVNEEIDVIAEGGPKEGIKQGVQGGVAGGVSGGVSNGASGGVAGGIASGVQGKMIRVRIGGEVQAPKILEKVPPVYPEKAKAAGIDGTVILHAIISMDGNPLSLRVMNNQIDPDLARAAVEAVSKWRYKPTLLNGEPVEVDTTIKVNFTLKP